MGDRPGAYLQPVRCRPVCRLVGKLKKAPLLMIERLAELGSICGLTLLGL